MNVVRCRSDQTHRLRPEFNASLFALACVEVPQYAIAERLRVLTGRRLSRARVSRWFAAVESVQPEFAQPLRALACAATSKVLLLASIASARNPSLLGEARFLFNLDRTRRAHDALFLFVDDPQPRSNRERSAASEARQSAR